MISHNTGAQHHANVLCPERSKNAKQRTRGALSHGDSTVQWHATQRKTVMACWSRWRSQDRIGGMAQRTEHITGDGQGNNNNNNNQANTHHCHSVGQEAAGQHRRKHASADVDGEQLQGSNVPVSREGGTGVRHVPRGDRVMPTSATLVSGGGGGERVLLPLAPPPNATNLSKSMPMRTTICHKHSTIRHACTCTHVHARHKNRWTM